MNESRERLRVADVSLKYPRGGGAAGRSWALQDVSFSLDQGDRLGVVGLNGAGKSTLLRVLANIYTPDSGTVYVNGEVAAIFNASLGFIQGATGWENIFLRAAIMGLSIKETRAIAPSIVEFAGLGDWIYRPITEYSSGMALRLAFSISTAVDIDVLLMDEWLGAGDAKFLERASERMFELVERSGVLVLATHNIQLMRKVCNKALLLDGGRMIVFGALDEVVDTFRERTSQPQKL